MLEFAFSANYYIATVESTLSVVSLSLQGIGETTIFQRSNAKTYLIQPKDEKPWVLEITGDLANPEADGIYGCPSPNHFLAVTDSVAYYVNSQSPLDSLTLTNFPVQQIRSFPAFEMLLVIDFFSLTAIGPSGILWRSNRLVVDELKVVRATNEHLFCCGRYEFEFLKLDRLTGKVLEGNPFSES